MNITSLPLELVHLMIENLKTERRSLHALTLTSKALRREANRFLYLSMTDANETTQHKFLLTIQSHPTELAPLVRTYHTPAEPPTDPFWELIRGCLTLMVNLKELTYHQILDENPVHIFPSVGEGQKMPFQLNKFKWMMQHHKYNNQLKKFLETQHDLTHFRWSTFYSAEFPEKACPRLTSFEGSINAIVVVLPSHSISELFWVDDLTLKFLHSSYIIKVLQLAEFAALRGLSIQNDWVWEAVVMHPGFKATSSLEVLEIPFLFHVYPDQLEDGDLNWTTLCTVLPKFPHLKKLVVTMDAPFTQDLDEQDDPTSEIGQLFVQCLHLKYVDVLWDHDYLYRRWVVGGPLPDLLSIKRDRVLKFEWVPAAQYSHLKLTEQCVPCLRCINFAYR